MLDISKMQLFDARQVIAGAIYVNRGQVVANMKKLGYNVSGYTDEQLTNVLMNLNVKYNIVPIINVPVYDLDVLNTAKQYYRPASKSSNVNGLENGTVTDGQMQGKMWWEILLAAAAGAATSIGVNGMYSNGQPMPQIPATALNQTLVPIKYIMYAVGGIIVIAIGYFIFKSVKK